MEPWDQGARVALIRLAEQLAGDISRDDPALFLRRFRAAYQHLAATYDAAAAAAASSLGPAAPGFTPMDPMMGMRNPADIRRAAEELLERTDAGLHELGDGR